MLPFGCSEKLYCFYPFRPLFCGTLFLVLWFLNRVCYFHYIVMLWVELLLILFCLRVQWLHNKYYCPWLYGCLIIWCLCTYWNEMFPDIKMRSLFWNMSLVLWNKSIDGAYYVDGSRLFVGIYQLMQVWSLSLLLSCLPFLTWFSIYWLETPISSKPLCISYCIGMLLFVA